MIQVSIATILWILYSCMEGNREGLYWYLKMQANSIAKYHEHKLWTAQRAVVLIGLSIVAMSPWFILSGMLLFPLCHDGAYYAKRDRLKPGTYPKKWLDHSKTSTAFFTKYFPPNIRIASFIIGGLLNSWIIKMTEAVAFILKLY